MTFTPTERRLLALADQVEDTRDTETPAEREARWSRESRERRRQRMGDAAYREMVRVRRIAWLDRRKERRHA
jgi:hypothetical protein